MIIHLASELIIIFKQGFFMRCFYFKMAVFLLIIIAFSHLFSYEALTTFSVGHALRAAIRFNTLYFDTPQENLQDLIAYTLFLMERELEYPSTENVLFSKARIDYYDMLLKSYSASEFKIKTGIEQNSLLIGLRSDLSQSLPVLLRFFESASRIIFIDRYYFEVIQAYQNALKECA